MWPKATQRGPSVVSPLRSDVSHDGQAGRLYSLSMGQRTFKVAKSQGGLPGLSPLRSDGSDGSQVGRLDSMSGGQICSNESRKTTLGGQGTY